MKRLHRDAEKFDVLDLYGAMARIYGYKLDNQEHADEFIKRVKASFERSKAKPIMLHGKRIETLFAYVVGALGNASIIKQEDAGDIYSPDDSILVPDYRITLNGGEQVLIEVKNCNDPGIEKPYRIKKDYFEKMQHYADLNKVAIKYAIYFSRFGKWTLLSPAAFTLLGNNFETSFIQALARSEMAILGDRTIATTPDLEFIMEAGEGAAHKIDNGEALFVAKSIRMYCAGTEIIDTNEKQLAFQLMRFGEWDEVENEVVIDDEKVTAIRFRFSPRTPSENQAFQMIGALSSMVTNGFKEFTVAEQGLVAINAAVEPAEFQMLIPKNYKSDRLPLWQFEMRPNYEFIKESGHT